VTLRVGLATTAVVRLVGETLRRFAEDRPDIHLAVSNHGMIDPSAGLRAGTVDVGFVRPPFTDDGVVAMETVLTEPRYIVLREGHPLAERESLQPHDVVGEPWIYVEGADPKTRAFWSLEEFRDEPLRTGTRVNSFEEAFAAVLAGLASPRSRTPAFTRKDSQQPLLAMLADIYAERATPVSRSGNRSRAQQGSRRRLRGARAARKAGAASLKLRARAPSSRSLAKLALSGAGSTR